MYANALMIRTPYLVAECLCLYMLRSWLVLWKCWKAKWRGRVARAGGRQGPVRLYGKMSSWSGQMLYVRLSSVGVHQSGA